jgi:hypothetical protein
MLNLSKGNVEVILMLVFIKQYVLKSCMGGGGIVVQFLNYTSRLIKMCGLLHAPATLPVGKTPLTSFKYGPQRQSGYYGKEKNNFCWEMNPNLPAIQSICQWLPEYAVTLLTSPYSMSTVYHSM